MSQPKAEEPLNIEQHTEYIKKVIKWSITDLERLQTLLKARIAAEEAYIASLQKINKNVTVPVREPIPFFGNDPDFQRTSLQRATFKYEAFVGKTIESRNGLIAHMKYELETLAKIDQEARKKRIKLLDIANKSYLDYRKEVPKLQRTYAARCDDLITAKNQLEQQVKIQQQQLQLNSSASSSPVDQNYDLLDTDSSSLVSRPSMEENPKVSSETSRDADLASTTVIAISPPDGSGHHRRRMGGFMAQMRSQLANVAAAASATNAFIDTSKHNVKFAKLKKEIHDADEEYRAGIFELERRRKTQLAHMDAARREMEIELKRKSEITREVLQSVLGKEKFVLDSETEFTNTSFMVTKEINQDEDMKLFLSEYENHNFVPPAPVHYWNHAFGECEELLFGSCLQDYYEKHQKTIPVVVSKCISAVEDLGGLQKEGIYRVSGRQTNLEILKNKFEQNENVELMDNSFDVFTIASVLKIYLRELSAPLFDFGLSMRIEYSKQPDVEKRIHELRRRISLLSDPHRDTLYILTTHLAKVNENSRVNKMHIQNLSVIFTPAIFKDFNQAEVPGEWANDVVFEDLVHYYKEVFGFAPIEAPDNPVAVVQQKPGGRPMSSYSHNQNGPKVTINDQASQDYTKGMLLTSPMSDPLTAHQHADLTGHSPTHPPTHPHPHSQAPTLPPRQHATNFGKVLTDTSNSNSNSNVPSIEKALPELAVQQNILINPPFQKALPEVRGHKSSLSEAYSQKALPDTFGLAPTKQKERPKSFEGDYPIPPGYEFPAQPPPAIDSPAGLPPPKPKRPSLGNIRSFYSRKNSVHHKQALNNEIQKLVKQPDVQSTPPIPIQTPTPTPTPTPTTTSTSTTPPPPQITAQAQAPAPAPAPTPVQKPTLEVVVAPMETAPLPTPSTAPNAAVANDSIQ
ncbi:hypothetical protein J3Q64DRAFT_1827403 [Phycomyces blakesleeanus]|uniref:Rho-GAP domain-containing protein n=1 Tax=Phycomyces blakesleeanus TaxID=4837 RepID=A0ABR3BBV9_PHYBL